MPDRVTRVIAIRHGETAWNVDTRLQGQLDIPLNDTGRWQAQRLAEALAHEPLAAIYSSDLSRAWATAEALSITTGLTVRADERLRERCFGAFQGQTWADIETQWPESSQRWRQRDLTFAPPGGENLPDFSARVVSAAAALAAAHPGETIALVAHGGVMDCLYRAATRIDMSAPRSWQLGNASINRLLYTPEGFSLVGWSDTHHLDAVRDESADGGAAAAVGA
jgi:probable phosphoglycerate mutase